MAKDLYLIKIRDPRWQKKRLLILSRDSFTCQFCGDNKTELHVHHGYYIWDKDPWDYPDAALITLCSSCHSTESTTNDRSFLIQLRHLGYSSHDISLLKEYFSEMPTHYPASVTASILAYAIKTPDVFGDMVYRYFQSLRFIKDRVKSA